MAFFDWDDKYSVGIESVDSQHKRLFQLVSDFYETIREKEVKHAMKKTMKGLMDYTTYHFSTEEGYMEEYGYPQLATHKAQHSKFVDKVTDFHDRMEAGQLVVPVEIANFLKDWLSHHVMESDQQLAPFLRGKGIK